MSDFGLGPPIRPEATEPEAKWLPYKKGFVRHSVTGKIATSIPANEAVNHNPWKNWPIITPTGDESG